MIKFWKNTAKGKTGCPVRPPEQSPSNSNANVFKIQLEDVNEDHIHVLRKESKLSLSLNDILVEKKALKYFIQYMETIGKHLLIKCWLELDNFKAAVSSTSSNDNLGNHSKLCRAKSFDYDHRKNTSEFALQNWKENDSSLANTSETKQGINDGATSSCHSLVELSSHSQSSAVINKNEFNITEEAIELFKKYVALEAPYQLVMSEAVRNSVISNICDPGGKIQKDCFKLLQDSLFIQIENEHFSDFQRSPFYIKAQIDILTSGSLNLEDIIYNETILFYFTEYLEQESCAILLEFFMAVIHFRDNLINDNMSNVQQAEADAIVLYDKYFSLQATHPIGFSNEVRLKIESDICREGGPLPSCFDLPFEIIYRTLNNHVKIFLQSELYYKYLSEMVHSVDQMWSTNNAKSQSDSSSEFSISTQNTLLAMGDPVFRRKKRNYSVPDMTIDSNQLYNADALWQRKKQDGLTLGRVNSLGRFESKFEPDPDKKEKSVFKKMMSRFVPMNTSKVEEEMAWQVAHMIVKDVTDLTMAPLDTVSDDV